MLGVAAAVVLLAVAAALIATLLINPDRYKGEIEAAVQRATGRPLVLEGHLRLTWFPWLGVRTGAGRLGNPPGAGGPDLLDWQSAQVRVRLLPLLLHRRLEVGRIRLVGADIHLRRRPDGGGSWDDLVARLKSGNPTSPAAVSTPAAARTSSASPITLAGLDLERSSLDYVDEHSREHVRLAGWQLDIGPLSAGEPLSLRTRFVLHAEAPGPPAVVPVATGTGAKARTGAGGWRAPAAGVALSLDVPRLSLQATPLEATAPQWSLQVGDARLHGAADVRRDVAGHLTASGSLTAAVPSLRQLAQTLGIALPALEDPAALGSLTLSGSWRYRGGALTVKPLAAKLDSTTLTGWIAWAGGWTFALRADEIDFGRYRTRSNQQTPFKLPVRALRALHAQGTLQLDRAQIDGTTLEDARLQVQ